MCPFSSVRCCLLLLQQETVKSLPELIGNIPGWGNIPNQFDDIVNSRGYADRAWTGRVKLLWQYNSLEWDRFDSGALAAHEIESTMCGAPASSSATALAPTFVVRNANKGDNSADGSLPEVRGI